jgi:excisionase family DNA binding protein
MRHGSTWRMVRTRNQREGADVAANDGARNAASTLRFLRVEEAARILRIGRSTAYEQANRWIATNGQCGLPAVKVGRMIRIPAAVLEAWATIGSDAEPISESQ